MIEPTHSRQEDWEGWPFHSVADVAEFVSELVAMVEEAAGSAPHLSTTVTYEDRQYDMQSLAELREAAPGLDLADMHELSAMIFWSWGEPRPVGATFSLRGGAYHRETQLRVSGSKGTAVDGVNVGAAASVERRVEKEREREASEAAAAEAKPVDVEAVDVEARVEAKAVEPRPAWRRFLDHQYSVQIIGGAVGSVIAALVLLLVLQQS